MRTHLILIPLFSLLVACQHPGDELPPGVGIGSHNLNEEPSLNPWATTEKNTYKAGEKISVTIGTLEGPISVRTCCSTSPAYFIDRLDDGVWGEYMRQDIDCMKMCAQYGVPVSSSLPLQAVTEPGVMESGTYRFRFLYADEITSNKELISNTFMVE